MVHHEIEVAVLGPVEIRGVAQPFRRTAARELIVYLAFHRGRVRHGDWSTALWPNGSVSPGTVHSTVSDARRVLGVAHDGREHLPRAGSLAGLSDSVGTDVDRFSSLAGAADPRMWKEAMRLIRGTPFGALRLGDWAVFDGTQSQVESMVAEAALRWAASLAAWGRGDEAEWIVRQALRSSPYDERLYRALLQALEVQGNRLRLRRAMADLRMLAGEALHPETTALYRGLLEGSPVAGEHPARL